MSPYPTDLYVASQTARELVVVDPPYMIVSTIFTVCGLLFLLGGLVALSILRVGFARPLQMVLWFLPALIGSPFVILAALTGATTRIIVSTEANKLSVRKSVLSFPLRTKEYPLEQVRLVKVGVGNVCRFLYVSLTDKPAEDLTSCTDRTGYSEVADALNSFLDGHRQSGFNLRTQDGKRVLLEGQ
jgi:hypothetical protein